VYNDYQALAYFTDFVAHYAEPGLFADAFRVFYAEQHGGFNGPGVRLQGKVSGYRSEFQDQADTSNADQAHHFAFFFGMGAKLSFSDPETAATTIIGGAWALEVHNLFRDGVLNTADVRLGIAAGMMGYMVGQGINAGRTDAMYGPAQPGPRDLGSMIRKELCK